MVLDCPNNFGQVPIVLDKSNSFWSGPNHFRQVQIIKISPEKYNLNLPKMICTQPKQFAQVQNNLYRSKTIWTIQNNFGTIEGQYIYAALDCIGCTQLPGRLFSPSDISKKLSHRFLLHFWIDMGSYDHHAKY
jgi:hypothetical protein